MTRILIVDDSAFLRRIIRGHLTNDRLERLAPDGYVLSEASSKAEALLKIEIEHPDLVLLDIVMDCGERDGVEILETLRQENPAAKVIMMSAVGQEQVIWECMSKGALGYLLKPFEAEQVLAAVESALSAQPETARNPGERDLHP